MWFWFSLHWITIPFVRLHEFATNKNNDLDDLLYSDPYTTQLINKRAEKENKKNGNIGSL